MLKFQSKFDIFINYYRAYETLGDEVKRKNFDEFGVTGDEQEKYKQQYGSDSPFEAFKGNDSSLNMDDFKKFWNGMEEFFGGSNSNEANKGKDINAFLELSFLESVEGTQKTLTFERTVICSSCNGSKCKPGTSPTKCGACSGSGKIFFKQGNLNVAMDCSVCNAEGAIIKEPCNTCHGKGLINTKASETLNTPKGISDGMNIRVGKKGHCSYGGINGDLFIKIKVTSHPIFKRTNFDIHSECKISITQAVLGAKLKIKTLYGETPIVIEAGTNDGEIKKLPNYGITKLPPNQTEKGHHYVKIKIAIPNKLSPIQKDAYVKLSEVEDKVEEN